MSTSEVRETPERATPGMRDAVTMGHHVIRYGWALSRVAGLHVLDLGCGAGYGTEILSWAARSARGFDLWRPEPGQEPSWPGPASLTWGHDLCADELPRANAGVMFEVLEHLPAPEAALDRVFAAVDTLVVSFPNPALHGSHAEPAPRQRLGAARGARARCGPPPTATTSWCRSTRSRSAPRPARSCPGAGDGDDFWIFVVTTDGRRGSAVVSVDARRGRRARRREPAGRRRDRRRSAGRPTRSCTRACATPAASSPPAPRRTASPRARPCCSAPRSRRPTTPRRSRRCARRSATTAAWSPSWPTPATRTGASPRWPASPTAAPALTLAALRDRLEAAGFAVERVRRVRRAGSHPGAVLGASAGILARFLAEDPDATVDWYVVEAGASAAAAELAAARDAGAGAGGRAGGRAGPGARARRRGGDGRDRAAAPRARRAGAPAAASARQAAHERETLHAQLEAARARIQELEATVAELHPLASASRDAAARAARAEADLHAITDSTAYRAMERYWRLKGRVVRLLSGVRQARAEESAPENVWPSGQVAV